MSVIVNEIGVDTLCRRNSMRRCLTLRMHASGGWMSDSIEGSLKSLL